MSGSRRWTLASRLGLRLAAVLLAAILLAAGAVAWRAVETVHELDDQALQAQLRLIARHLPADPASPIVLPQDLVRSFRASDGDNVFLITDGGRLVDSSEPETAARLLAMLGPAPPQGFFRLPALDGRRHGMIGLSAPAGPFQVVVLQGREQTAILLDSLFQNFAAGALFLLLPLGLMTIAVAMLTVRRGLRPLREVSAAARLVGPQQPGARLPSADLPEEVRPLVDTVNAALQRLDQALVAQRHFMADAAHALRTPLAVMTARLDMLDGLPELEGLRHDTDGMARLVGQLLRMARLEAVALDITQTVRLHDVAAEAISALVPLALRAGVELALVQRGEPAEVHGNHAALVLALTNLIENAIAHAPLGTVVEVALAGAELSVRDHGPGVPEALRTRIFERFTRGPHGREGGAGLGLAIVAEIAAAHHGTVRLETPDDGGSRFVLALA
jgi:signal transduction histidine kinase